MRLISLILGTSRACYRINSPRHPRLRYNNHDNLLGYPLPRKITIESGQVAGTARCCLRDRSQPSDIEDRCLPTWEICYNTKASHPQFFKQLQRSHGRNETEVSRKAKNTCKTCRCPLLSIIIYLPIGLVVECGSS